MGIGARAHGHAEPVGRLRLAFRSASARLMHATSGTCLMISSPANATACPRAGSISEHALELLAQQLRRFLGNVMPGG
jgi:hypothetical protein